jgi:transcriptional regulator with XRE-family HTH domain
MSTPLALVRDVSSFESGDAAGARTSASLDALEHVVGVNLARLRAERQLSLDALARLSGVSRAMLAQIESARSVPSIKVLCKIAAALKVSVAAFLRRHAVNGFEHLAAERAVRVVSSNGRFSARALYPKANRPRPSSTSCASRRCIRSLARRVRPARRSIWWSARARSKSACMTVASCSRPATRSCSTPTSRTACATPATAMRARSA